MKQKNGVLLESVKLTKGQRTARQILEAAARCVQTLGIEKTSVTNIAKEAGLKRSLIAYHFPKKAEIFYQVVVHIIHEIRKERNKAITGVHGKKRLKAILKTYGDFFLHHSHYFTCYLHFHYMASIDDKYKRLNTESVKVTGRQMSSCLNELIQDAQIDLDDDIKNPLIEDFADILYKRLIGSIMSYYTREHNTSEEKYKVQYLIRLEKEIDLFLAYCRRFV